MSLPTFVRFTQAELISLRIACAVSLSRCHYRPLGSAKWLTRMLRGYAGQADRRSIPVDWARVISCLRDQGWTGALPRSFRKYDAPLATTEP